MLLLSGESSAEDIQPSLAANEEYEMDSWTSAKEINTIEAYEVYLAEHANGRHAKFAQAAINKIKKAENPKGGEESNVPRVKDATDAASKQPAPAAPAPVAPTPTAEVPPASAAPAAVEPKVATQPAASSAGNADAGKGENTPKP